MGSGVSVEAPGLHSAPQVRNYRRAKGIRRPVCLSYQTLHFVYTFSLQIWQTSSNDCTNDSQDILIRSLEQEDGDDVPQSIRDFRLIKVIGQGAFSKGDSCIAHLSTFNFFLIG